MEVIILAGGLGTRLKSIVNDIPKCMAPVSGQPFIFYIFLYLKRYSIINKVILSLGYKHEHVLSWIESQDIPFDINFSIENSPLGTGGAIKKALNLVNDNSVLILNGDTFFDVDLNLFIQQHLSCDSKLSIALKPMYNFERYGNVEVDNKNRIVNFEEKKFLEKGQINGGIYLLNKNILNSNDLPEKFSFEQDILQVSSNFKNFHGFVHDNYFIDIGVPEDYKKAILDFKSLFNDNF